MANHERTSPAEIQEHLAGVDYPASKEDLIRHAREQNAPTDVLSVLQRVDDRTYSSPVDLMRSVGEVM